MEQQLKQQLRQKLMEAFVSFTNTIAAFPGAPVQKQQAFLKFDEGHMWMQNAIDNFQMPQNPAPGESQNDPQMESQSQAAQPEPIPSEPLAG